MEEKKGGEEGEAGRKEEREGKGTPTEKTRGTKRRVGVRRADWIGEDGTDGDE